MTVNDYGADDLLFTRENESSWACTACTVINTSSSSVQRGGRERCPVCDTPREYPAQSTSSSSHGRVQQRAGRNRIDIGGALSQAGQFISTSSRAVMDKTKEVVEEHRIKERTQELGRKTKSAAQTAGAKASKLDEKLGFTNALIGAAVGVSAMQFASPCGSNKAGMVALGVAGTAAVAQTCMNEQRERDAERERWRRR